jgi:hypothetical protein
VRDLGTARHYAGVFAEDGHAPQQAPLVGGKIRARVVVK